MEDHIKATVVLFTSHNPSMVEEVKEGCSHVRRMLSDLTPGESPYKLTNGHHKVDFLVLMDYLKKGKFERILLKVRSIKSELILMMTQPGANINAIVHPLSFWDNFEATLNELVNN
jgi:hypothetical protein